MSGRKQESVRTHPPGFLTFVLGGWNLSNHFHEHKNAHTHTHIAQTPVLQPWGCNQKILLPLCELKPDRSDLHCSVDNSHISVQQQVDRAESAVMTTDRQTDCRCARVRSINVIEWIMLSFGLTSLSVYGKTQARTFIIKSVFLNHIINRCYWLSWLLLSVTLCLLYLSDRNTYIQICAQTHNHLHTHISCLQAKPQNKDYVLQLQADWSDKPKLFAPWPTSWFTAIYGFYSTHSPLITWKIYQNYSPETACSQPELCLHVRGRRCEYPPMAIICSVHFMMKEADNRLWTE